jgi:hypothetical protein
MPNHVCNLASTTCTFGAAPGKLMVLPKNRVFTDGQPAANIMDNIPFVNILPFGNCISPANPATAAATAAALGVLTPAPCLPNPVGPWAPGSPTVLLAGPPSLNMTSKLICAAGGVIQVVVEGQAKHTLP